MCYCNFYFSLQVILNSSLSEFINGIPDALAKQYKYEELQLGRGDQLVHSPFLTVRHFDNHICNVSLSIVYYCQSVCSLVHLFVTNHFFSKSTKLFAKKFHWNFEIVSRSCITLNNLCFIVHFQVAHTYIFTGIVQEFFQPVHVAT